MEKSKYKTSSRVSGNKIESFCGKYTVTLKYSIFCLVKLRVSKIPLCSSHFFKKKICSFTMAFTLDHVKSFVKSNSVYELRNVEPEIFARFKKSPRVTQTKL